MNEAVISLCDFTGNMVLPWAEAGYECWCFDILHSIRNPKSIKNIHYMWGDARTVQRPTNKKIAAVFAFPPCTHVTVSGSQDWGTQAQNGKDRARNGRMARGEANNKAILTEEIVRKLRNEYKYRSRTHGLEPLGKKYGIDFVTIWSMLIRFKHTGTPNPPPSSCQRSPNMPRPVSDSFKGPSGKMPLVPSWMMDDLNIRIWRGDGGYWSWCRSVGADSVYGGFESYTAAFDDAAKTLKSEIVK